MALQYVDAVCTKCCRGYQRGRDHHCPDPEYAHRAVDIDFSPKHDPRPTLEDLQKENAPIRKFETGATRDTDTEKYDYEGFLSPVVLEAFGRYMHKHRFLPNGDVRASDNWQKHFGENHFSVCTKSLWRHFMDLWSEHRGLKSREGLEDALMGILFNTMAYADKYLKDKHKNRP